MEGWIKLHRTITEWDWYTDNNTKSLFIHLLLMANSKDNEWRGVIIKRGQRFTSINSLSNELRLTPKQVRVSINKLIKTKEITISGASNGTMITICKYDNYQNNSETKGEQEGKRRANEGQTKGNKQEGKERKERKEVLLIDSEFSKFEKLLNADNWQDKFPDVDLKYYYDTINDWSLSNNKKYVDWLAMIRNWIRRDFQQNKMVKNYNKIINGVVIGRTAM